MLSTLFFFNEPFTNIVTITFTALVITELLNVYSEVSYFIFEYLIKINKPNCKMFISSVLTFACYIASIVLLRSYFDTSYLTWRFFLKVLAITLLSWLPLHIVKCLIMRFDPTE